MRPSLPRRDGVGATDAESRGVYAFGLMGLLVRVEREGGSIDGVGNDFQSFRLNDLKLVDQNSAIWNQVAVLLSRIDALRLGA